MTAAKLNKLEMLAESLVPTWEDEKEEVPSAQLNPQGKVVRSGFFPATKLETGTSPESSLPPSSVMMSQAHEMIDSLRISEAFVMMQRAQMEDEK
jgi:hypothetical protein